MYNSFNNKELFRLNEFGDLLRKLRGNMTFREAAERSGISHSYIRYLETGKRPGTNTPIKPSPDMLKGLSKAYNHPYKELMKMAGYNEDVEKMEVDEDEFIRDIEIHSTEDLINKYNIIIDGKEMTEDEAKDFLAFLRMKRSL